MFDGRKAENIRIINVGGDSMSGKIEPGDVLFVDITVKSFDGDGIYAFLYDDTAHVKRLQMMEVLRSVEYSFDDARHMFDGRKAENIRIINVRGDSMSGTIEPGDLLFVDITVKSFDGDGIYAFLYDDTAHVKRLQMMKDKLLVISDNKSYSPWDPIEKDEMNRVFIFGKVIGSMPQTYRKHG